MESSARFPERDATDLLEMRENNQSKNTQRSKKTWIKVFDLWRAERSDVRKLEEIPENELDDFLCRSYAEVRKPNGCYIINSQQNYMLVQFGNNWIEKNSSDYQIGLGLGPCPIWKSSEFFSSNYFQIGQHVILLHIQIKHGVHTFNINITHIMAPGEWNADEQNKGDYISQLLYVSLY